MPPGLYNSLKLYSIRSRTTVTHAVEDFCCLLFVFPTSALLKREENEALGTAAQLRWTAARTEKRKASISRAWSLEALYCLYVFVVLCQRMLRAQVWATDMRRLGHVR